MSTYRITEVGFENREAVFFRTSIEMASEYDIAEWLFVGEWNADVILVNSDRKEYIANFIIEKPTKTNNRPILIGCSSNGKKCDSFSYTLKKPITYSMITTLLLKLELELAATAHNSPLLTEVTPTPDTNSQQATKDQSKPSSKSLRIKTYNIINSPTRLFIEEGRLLGLLRKPIFLGRPTEITHRIYSPIRIYPYQQIFLYQSNRRLSPNLFTTQASGFSIHELMKSELQAPSHSWITRPLWLLYYLATLYGSEGRLKENNHPNDRLSLTVKPDFDIVPNHLDYRTIADFMMANESQDLNTIAFGSGVNIKTVIDFCNACEEIDTIDRLPSTHPEIRLSGKISLNQKSKASDKYSVDNKGIIKRLYQYLTKQDREHNPTSVIFKET